LSSIKFNKVHSLDREISVILVGVTSVPESDTVTLKFKFMP